MTNAVFLRGGMQAAEHLAVVDEDLLLINSVVMRFQNAVRIVIIHLYNNIDCGKCQPFQKQNRHKHAIPRTMTRLRKSHTCQHMQLPTS